MEKIITYKGRTFRLDHPNITPQIETAALNNIIKLSGGECSSCASKSNAKVISAGTSNCISTAIQGSQHPVSATISQPGTPPYTYSWVITRPDSIIETNIQQSFNYLFSQAGTYRLDLTIRDSCPTGARTDTATCSVVVSAPTTLSSITLSGCSSLNVGGTCVLTATCRDQTNAVITCPLITWQSSNTTVATVNSSGVVTAVSSGTANITASASGITSPAASITVQSGCIDPGCGIMIS